MYLSYIIKGDYVLFDFKFYIYKQTIQIVASFFSKVVMKPCPQSSSTHSARRRDRRWNVRRRRLVSDTPARATFTQPNTIVKTFSRSGLSINTLEDPLSIYNIHCFLYKNNFLHGKDY